MMDREEKERLLADVEAADLVDAFMKSRVWSDVLEPYLAQEQNESKLACVWAPNIANGKALTVDDVALKVAFYSGCSASLERLIARLGGFIQAGKESRAELARIDKKS